jgi:chromosome segregation ATPase
MPASNDHKGAPVGKKIIIGLVLFLCVGLSGYLGYRLNALSTAHAALEQDLKKTAHRADLLQRKYAEQKAQATAFQRAKLNVEGLKRQAEMKADALAREVDEQAARIVSMEKKIAAGVKALEDRIAAKDNAIAQWKEKYAQLSAAFGQAKGIIGERDATIAQMEENTRQLESELQFVTRTRDRYRTDNKEMAVTAQSILARYDEEGVFAKTLLHVEPFTQIKKVELEQLIQDYLDSIDDHTIRDRE